MCGIAGFINFNRHDKAKAKDQIIKMADTISHRGPDEEGYYIDDYAALGHRRLSIIDLASGQQPMGSLEGQVQIIFNGEIYNFLEIRAQLQAKGYRFHTSSDTEVILLAYIEWGEGCIERLNGMFAFAIWDARNKLLLLARDRVGKKPLYYYHGDHSFAFASELKALQSSNFFPTKIDFQALDCYFSFGYIPAPRSIFASVKKLSAASYIVVSEKNLKERKYWELNFADPVARSMQDAADELQVLLDSAVQCRLMSEVPLGVFLSGGIDSPLVVAAMAQVSDVPVMTNTIGFDEHGFNELPAAKLVAEHLKTDHREFIVKPEITNILGKIAWHCDEPFADSSAVPTWYVCQMARQNVTVALSGDGGDESFGGYTFRYLPHLLESKIRAFLPSILRRPIFGTLGSLWPGSARLPKPLRLKTIFENLAVSDVEAFYRDLIWLRGDIREALYTPDFKKSLQGFTPIDTIYPLYTGNNATGALGRAQFTDIHFFMTDDVLMKVDRMSMAHSLEVRSPLLDYRIIEFAARLPTNLKLNSRQGKLILRELAARRLPSEIEKKPKLGFSIPTATWLRNQLKGIAEDVIFDKNRMIYNILKEQKVKQIWQEHQSRSRDHSVFLWGLMMLGLWEQAYL